MMRRAGPPALLMLYCLARAASAATLWDCSADARGVWHCNGNVPQPAAPPPAPASAGESPSTDSTPAGGQAETIPASGATTDTAQPSVLPAPPGPTAQPAATPAAVSATPPAPAPAAAATTAPALTGVAENRVSSPAVIPAAAPNPATVQTAAEDDRWAQCEPEPSLALPADESESIETDEDLVDLRADSANASRDRTYTLSGDAVIRYKGQELRASQLTYRQQAGAVEAANGIHYRGPLVEVRGERALLHTNDDRGVLESVSYRLPLQHARGSASQLTIDGAYRQQLENASYTTCPEGSNDWQLRADRVDLDHQDGSGVARNARITFKQVPFLYTPYISFPLSDQRKSGLLFPRIATSKETGIDVSLPVYWNIAPNRDATFTPRTMSGRGEQLSSEFRYLTQHDTGMLQLEYMPSDRKYNDQARSLFRIQESGNPNRHMETRLNITGTSDRDYFEDLGNSLTLTSQTSLERTAGTTWHGNDWMLGMLVQNFQNMDRTLASADRPYRQVPQIRLDFTPSRHLLGLKATTEAELNHFTHPDPGVVTGTRFDITPRLSLPLRHAGWYMEPALGVRYTSYVLDNTVSGTDSTPDRTTPIASFDSGMFFERNGHWGAHDYVQTLEPRLYYLYVSERDQSALPVFDTGIYDFNFWTLFRDNRFNGPDRMGDANQLALAVTSRFVDPDNGVQMLSLSLGSLLYFRDRTVTLPGSTVDVSNRSDLIGELNLALTRFWSARGELLWNQQDSTTARSNYYLQYRRAPRQLINLGYRYREAVQEQVDVSFLWPLSRSWHAVGRWYVDLDTDRTIEALAGLGYESCCWSLQLLGRSYINTSGADRTSAVFLQLELKGLGKLGSSVDDALERGILGYQPDH